VLWKSYAKMCEKKDFFLSRGGRGGHGGADVVSAVHLLIINKYTCNNNNYDEIANEKKKVHTVLVHTQNQAWQTPLCER
jgi:hypothetical protein